MSRKRGGLLLSGRFRYEVEGDNGIIVARGSFPNGICLPAIDDLLDDYFSNGTTPVSFFIGLIDDTNFDELSPDDTMSSHAGWEEATAYSQATRPAWGPASSSGQFKANSDTAIFTMTSVITVVGLFITSDSAKSGTSGILWASGLFDVEQALPIGKNLKAYYELRGAEG